MEADFELFLQDLRGAVDIRAEIFHLLDALSKPGQIFRDGSLAAWLSRR